jgi:hypothetical protein
VNGLDGVGVGDSVGDPDGKDGGIGNVGSVIRGVDAAVTGVGVVESEGKDTSGSGRSV